MILFTEVLCSLSWKCRNRIHEQKVMGMKVVNVYLFTHENNQVKSQIAIWCSSKHTCILAAIPVDFLVCLFIIKDRVCPVFFVLTDLFMEVPLSFGYSGHNVYTDLHKSKSLFHEVQYPAALKPYKTFKNTTGRYNKIIGHIGWLYWATNSRRAKSEACAVPAEEFLSGCASAVPGDLRNPKLRHRVIGTFMLETIMVGDPPRSSSPSIMLQGQVHH